ncbi:hypothetical protein GF340_05110 [Candidatus Peregrinibacteria bacterium]|nr:hypothetical protein [Candidatus Peregrinibacteria bacterium]
MQKQNLLLVLGALAVSVAIGLGVANVVNNNDIQAQAIGDGTCPDYAYDHENGDYYPGETVLYNDFEWTCSNANPWWCLSESGMLESDGSRTRQYPGDLAHWGDGRPWIKGDYMPECAGGTNPGNDDLTVNDLTVNGSITNTAYNQLETDFANLNTEITTGTLNATVVNADGINATNTVQTETLNVTGDINAGANVRAGEVIDNHTETSGNYAGFVMCDSNKFVVGVDFENKELVCALL